MSRSDKTNRTKKEIASSVIKPQSRKIPLITKLGLVAHAAGRCQFDGCNRFLFEHHLTLSRGNFSQFAHIVAFSKDGSRGKSELRSEYIHDISNLMLLCPECHKLIDDDPKTYSVEVLRQHKEAHEQRIRHLTELAPERKTTVLSVVSQVRDQKVSIPFEQMVHAVSPRYPSNRRPCIIDLSILEESGVSFISAATDTIENKINRYLGPQSDFSETGHLSLFALARISLLVFLGFKLGNKISVDLFQRHRDTQDWTWKTNGEPVNFTFSRVQEGGSDNVALILPLSGTIANSDLPEEIQNSYTIYSISPLGLESIPSLLRQRRDLQNFRATYLQGLSTILSNHGLLDSIAFIPAIPAPVAVLCGQELLPKVHPGLEVYEREADGYRSALVINH